MSTTDWISIVDSLPDSLPPVGNDVLVLLDSGKVSLGQYTIDREWIPTPTIEPTYEYSLTMFEGGATVVHWMPIPKTV
jgi:hypothetical protein